jgi:hypothetical protein
MTCVFLKKKTQGGAAATPTHQIDMMALTPHGIAAEIAQLQLERLPMIENLLRLQLDLDIERHGVAFIFVQEVLTTPGFEICSCIFFSAQEFYKLKIQQAQRELECERGRTVALQVSRILVRILP